MRINYLYFICINAVFFYNCNNQNALENNLQTDCFWDILDIGSIHPINSCYKFNKDGTCNFYYYNYFEKRRTDSVYIFNDNDVVVPNYWKLLNDSLIIQSNKYYVIRNNFDSIVMTATGFDTVILIKNCKTFSTNK